MDGCEGLPTKVSMNKINIKLIEVLNKISFCSRLSLLLALALFLKPSLYFFLLQVMPVFLF
jgi:hypothetical protein